MGCSPTRNTIYNNYIDGDLNKEPENLSGPFVRTNKTEYDQNVKSRVTKTYIEELIECLSKFEREDGLGWRKTDKEGKLEQKFTYLKYRDIKAYSYNLASNLVEYKLASKDVESGYLFLGFFAKNSAEWAMTDIACQLMGITSVTFYSTLGDAAFEHICNQTNVSTICISPDSVSSLIKYKNLYKLKNLQSVLLFDMSSQFEKAQIDSLIEAKFQIYSFTKLATDITSNTSLRDLRLPKPQDTLTICYTSGTTNLPKGVELTQSNFFCQMINIEDTGYNFRSSSYHLSYLPLAHIFERCVILLLLLKGSKIGFISGDVRTYLVEDMAILSPTHLIAVPRVLDTFRKSIMDKITKMPEGFSKNLVLRALETKKENLRQGGGITHGIYDLLVFRKIRNTFGGRIEVFVTGSAPLTKDLADDIKILFSVPILEGYGMTESTAGVTVSQFQDLSNTSTGGCLRTTTFKLVDVKEMHYDSNTKLDGLPSPTGEIYIGGACVFKAYFKNPEETKKTITPDGWLRTGDVGRILPGNNGLKIIDRVKEIFKLSQGEYIAPAKLEGVYGKSKYVQQICVYGDSTHNNIVGLIYPNHVNLKEYLTSAGKWKENSKVEDFLQDPQVLEEVSKDLAALAKENNLNSLESLKSFALIDKEFSITNECLTPTFKIVRRMVKKNYETVINSLYGKK
jgi:long-chain acyl-CoA synthetase